MIVNKNVSIKIIIAIIMLILFTNNLAGIKITKNQMQIEEQQEEEHIWPMFRHDLKHTGRTKYTGPQTPELAWKYKTKNAIVSSAAIHADGTIYVGAGANRSNISDPHLYAFNPDGTLKWKYDAIHGFFSSPAIGPDNTIYCVSNANNLYSITDKGTHAEFNWKENLQFVFGLSSPAVGEDGTIHVGSTSFEYYQFNPDGTIKWIYKTDWCIISSPAIDEYGTVYVGSKDHRLYAFDEQKSYMRWNYSTGTFFDGHCVDSSPAIADDGTIYVGTDPYGAYGQDPVPVATNFWAVNPNGTLKWVFETEDGVESSPAIGPDGTLYFGSYDGYLYSVEDSGDKGTLRWKYKTDGPIDGSPIVDADGTIYFASRDTYLYALYPDGSLKWRFKAEKGFESSPSIDDKGYLYIGSFDGYFYCIGTGGADVGVERIDTPEYVKLGNSIEPTATIRNYRKDKQKIDVKCEIEKNGDIIYTQTKNIEINGGESQKINFSEFEIENQLAIKYNVTITTTNPLDENTNNNIKQKTIVTSENLPPIKPTIRGTVNGNTGTEYEFIISSSDPNGDDLYYWIQWFEGCPGVTWEGPYESGEKITKKYTYEEDGNYVIKVKAKDTSDAESEWSELELKMPKNTILNKILELMQSNFKILQNYLSKYFRLYQ